MSRKTNKELIKEWLSQEKDYGEDRSGRLSYYEHNLYVNRLKFARIIQHPDGKPIILIDDAEKKFPDRFMKFFLENTKKYRKAYVPYPDRSPEDNYFSLLEHIGIALYDLWGTNDKDLKKEYLSDVKEYISDVNQIAKIFGFQKVQLTQLGVVSKQRENLVKFEKFLDDVTEKRDKLKLKEATKKVKLWLKGKVQQFPQDYYRFTNKDIFIRIDPTDSTFVQSSLGHSAPLESIKKVLALYEKVKATGKEYHAHTRKKWVDVNGYTLQYINKDGDVKIGCHEITGKEVERFISTLKK